MSVEDKGAAAFAEFEAAGEVEVGKSSIESNLEETPVEKPVKRGPPREAAKQTIDDDDGGDDIDAGDDDGEGEENSGDDDGEDKPKNEGHLKRLKRERAEARNEARELKARLAVYEELTKKQDLPNREAEDNLFTIGDAPDPEDSEKYPLGHLDDRYIEDKLDWLATKKAADRADAVLQRQQELQQNQLQQQQREALLVKVDDLASRGLESFDDFQETVVDAGIRGDWKLDQPTFEAAHEAENGAQILYELARDKKEAARVASLTPYGQLKYVLDRDAEISGKSKPRRIPGAGAPPSTQTRGANSSTRINPATDNLDDFEKAWAADAKGKR